MLVLATRKKVEEDGVTVHHGSLYLQLFVGRRSAPASARGGEMVKGMANRKEQIRFQQHLTGPELTSSLSVPYGMESGLLVRRKISEGRK